jgi:FkbM family methyltransferase
MSGRPGPIAKVSDALKVRLGPTHHRRLRRSLLPIYSRIPRIHWSQSGEDVILGELLSAPRGRYVDVGAAHPRLGSNTYFLYRRGWDGILIEPNPRSAAALIKARPRDRVIQAAAGAHSGSVEITLFESDYLSSIDAKTTAERCEAGESVEKILTVPLVALADLDIGARPHEPSLLSVDCEGADLMVLQGNDWEQFRPRVICVEESTATLSDPSAIRLLLEGQGYRLHAHTGLSAIYVHLGA